MKAFLLSAGKGTRLGKLTEQTPKCLLKVGNQTMLEHWFYLFSRYRVDHVLINTHHLAPKVASYCMSQCQDKKIKVTITYEKELLGTARTIYENRSFVRGDDYFFIAFADTWMNPNLTDMAKYHRRRYGVGTIGLYQPKNLMDQGVVKIERRISKAGRPYRKIVKITEKSPTPDGEYAFAGLMIGTHGMFRYVKNETKELVKDWLSVMAPALNPYVLEGHVLDIGTPERYAKANQIVSSVGLKAI